MTPHPSDTSDMTRLLHISEQLQNYADYHIQNVLDQVMIFITAWEYIRFIGAIFLLSSGQGSDSTHMLISGHGVVLKLPCHSMTGSHPSFSRNLLHALLHLSVLVWTIIGQINTPCRLVTSFPPDVLLLDIVSQTSENIVTTIVVPCDRIHTWSVKSGLESGVESES